MEFIRLDTVYYPLKLIEGWSSLVWTERYQASGDFELKTPNIQQAMTDLPLQSLVSLQETDEVMIVENLVIDKDENGKMILTVSGRSFETFFEGRVARPFGLSAAILNDATDDKSNDWVWLARSSALMAQQMLAYWSTSSNAVSTGLDIANYSVGFGNIPAGLEQNDYIVKPGTMYERLIEYLKVENFGVRQYRPRTIVNGVKTGILQTVIYKGYDKSDTTSFSTGMGHFRNGKYLWSSKNYRTGVEGYSYFERLNMTRPGTPATSADGYTKMIGFNDVSDIRKGSALASNVASIRSRNLAYLNEHKKVVMFSGDVVPNSGIYIGSSYDLGDLVNVNADFGVSQTMMVTEYTRIVDESGEKEYPTLEIPNELA